VTPSAGAEELIRRATVNYVVRRAQHEDLESLVSFTVAEAREAEGLDIDPSVVRRGVEQGLSNNDIAMYWVVESELGEIVASTSVVREWSDWSAQDYWWIQSMYVIPEHRGRGLPEMLIDRVVAEARANGAADLRLYVHERNSRAVRAYRRCGFGELPYTIMSKSLTEIGSHRLKDV
jgi:ribosomal protein S18 acetylase RimI-like enzyme